MSTDVSRARPAVSRMTVEPEMKPGEKFLAMKGTLAGQIWISDDFEFSEEELDEMYAEWDEEDKLL
ncbi:MAG: hypothetical protein ACRDLF_09585 [Solirubrobacteraceae bacterium]